HSADCYEWTRTLTCGMEEGEGGHRHTDACYESVTELACGKQELHVHTAACYDGAGRLTCGKLQLEEHVHGPGCFVEKQEPIAEETPAPEEPADPGETPAPEGPVEESGEPETGETPDADETEDTEDAEPESDPRADVESYWDYAARFENMDRTGPWNEVLVSVARTQLGYRESTRNFIIDENSEKQGYTRYGDWYGIPYGDWCAMFVSFCLNFADIPTSQFPIECGVTRWIDDLNALGLYTSAGAYAPRIGDVIFFDFNDDGLGDHVGIVSRVYDEGGAAKLETIEGNRTPTVQTFTYDAGDRTILGYGVLPERPTETKESLDLGLVQIAPADGEALPPEADGHAKILSGEEAAAAQDVVEAYLTAPAPTAQNRPMSGGAKPMGPMSAAEAGRQQFAFAENTIETGANETERRSEERYEVFDIGLEHVDEAAYEEGFRVSVTLPEAVVGRDFQLYHVGENGVEELSAQLEAQDNGDGTELVYGFTFVTPSFSPFVLRYTVDYYYRSVSGETYRITLDYGPDAGLPADLSLAVSELLAGSAEYAQYKESTAAALNVPASRIDYARFFDITLVKDGVELQPAEGSTVNVSIRLADAAEGDYNVVHYGAATEVLSAQGSGDEDGYTLSFSTGSFSIYAIVEAPEPITGTGWIKIASLDELAEYASAGLAMSHVDGYYFTDGITNITATRTGITKTAKVTSPEFTQDKVLYYFEPVGDGNDHYRVYCLDASSGGKRYINQTANSLSLVDEANATTFTVSASTLASAWRMAGSGGYYWNMQGGAGGKSFAAYTGANDANAQFCFWYYKAPPTDPYGLDGKSYVIVYSDDTVYGKTVAGEQREGGGLEVCLLPLLNTKDHTKFYVAKSNESTEWTFQYVSGFAYYLTAQVDGQTKYLTIDGTEVTLRDEPDPEGSLITVTPGTGKYKGKYTFSVYGSALELETVSDDKVFRASGTIGETSWLYLAETTELSEDDLLIYSARKVSVSDEEEVVTGQNVVIYTRVWNEETLKYEFYAIDHDGTLIRVYESGDVIQWVENSINT
ncbi:MAG: CHAP domain-containing protein, partial [Oscillospiraceae bacterium]|nr:CHAP domain-containing protein [Oscillospiraceae bacterium]